MKPFPVRIACVLAFTAAPWGTAGVRAQAVPSRPAATPEADTLTLTLGEAQRLALVQNPEFLAQRQESAIARGQLRQARLPAFNPELELRAPGATQTGIGAYEATLGQEVEWAGQRGMRVRAAALSVARSDLAVRDAARLSVSEASEAYYAALVARTRLQLAEDVLALNQRLLAAVRAQLREGEISAMEANLAEIEAGRAQARVLAARREATAAELDLKRAVGIAPAQPVRLAEEVPAPPAAATLHGDSLVALALARRPDLAARSAGVREAEALTQLTRREGVPNVRVSAVAERDGTGEPSRVGFGLGVPLPLLNRNQGRVAEQEARTQQARLETRATELRVRSEVNAAHQAYVSASEEAAVYEASVLGPARRNRELLETAYRAGKIDLPTLLLVRNQLMDAELGYWDTWLARRRALVELETATATLAGAETSAPPSSETNER